MNKQDVIQWANNLPEDIQIKEKRLSEAVEKAEERASWLWLDEIKLGDKVWYEGDIRPQFDINIPPGMYTVTYIYLNGYDEVKGFRLLLPYGEETEPMYYYLSQKEPDAG